MYDPFPNTENPTLEARLQHLFNKIDKVRFSKHPKLYNQTGEFWLDNEKGILYIREGAGVWTLQMKYIPDSQK